MHKANPVEQQTLILFAVGGLPGTGKTTVSRHLAAACGGDLLRTDVVRKELHPYPSYHPDETQQVYAEVMQRTRDRLSAGQSVVVDASFQRQRDRNAVAEVARQLNVPFHFVLVTAPEAVVAARLSQRHGDASDADFAVYQEMRDRFDPLEQPYTLIDNNGTLQAIDVQIHALVAAVQAAR